MLGQFSDICILLSLNQRELAERGSWPREGVGRERGLARGDSSHLQEIQPTFLHVEASLPRTSRCEPLIEGSHAGMGRKCAHLENESSRLLRAEKKNNKLNVFVAENGPFGPPFCQKSARKSLCGSLFCVLSQEMRHINFFLGAQNGVFWVGAKKFTVDPTIIT